MGKRYFEELTSGEEFVTPSRTLTETDVVMFAAQTGDYNEIHTSEVFASKTPFGRRLVHGLFGLGVSHGLMFRLGILDGSGVALLGLEDWRFVAPLFIGDTVTAKIKVLDKRLSNSKPGSGIVRFYVQVVKNDGTVVQQGIKVILMRCKDNDEK